MQIPRSLTAPVAAAFFSSSFVGCFDAPYDTSPTGGAYDVERYDLTGAYDWSRGRLVATVDITLTATGPELERVVLDSAVTEVTAVHADGVPLPFAVDEAGGRLVIDVRSLAGRRRGDTIVLGVDYEAASGHALVALPVRAGDPVAARALYTSSEPLGVPRWMPCHDRPDDRAVFSVDLRMGDDESMIANGDLELDDGDAGSGHRMRYATSYPLPTYLMAFAVSAFEVERGQKGDVPLAVWHRRGVPGDYQGLLGEIGREIGVFSGRLGPYPFEKYALVMLPEFPGGMENAGITFQSETGTAQPSLGGDVSLDAHELGHQWYGDLVTVATWDDLWIKEGMATLLSAEARRLFEDEDGAGTLLGDSFDPQDGEAVRDRSLAPGEKYTSGPYDRAAWLLTQIRAVAGEDAFWGALRGVLADHRFGVVSTDDLLAAFAPALGPRASARARRAVDARPLPTIEVAASGSGGALVTLHDPEEILVAPLEIEWHREDGAIERETLVPGRPRELRREAPGDFVVLDPRDVHPSFDDFLADDRSKTGFESLVAPLRAPTAAFDSSRFARLPGVHARAALAGGALPPVAPEAFASFVASLHSEAAKAESISVACGGAGAEEDPVTRLAWTAALTDVLRAPPHYAGLGYVSTYDACAELADPAALFASDWLALAGDLTPFGVPEPRLVFLSKFTLPPAEALTVWSHVVERSSSPRARALAARQIERRAAHLDGVAPAELAAWRSRLAELIGESEVSSVLARLIQAAVSLESAAASDNAALLAALAAVLRSPATVDVQPDAVCAVFALTAGDAAAFRDFAGDLAGAPLSKAAAALLADPTPCEP
jgi:hypothetical protein